MNELFCAPSSSKGSSAHFAMKMVVPTCATYHLQFHAFKKIDNEMMKDDSTVCIYKVS